MKRISIELRFQSSIFMITKRLELTALNIKQHRIFMKTWTSSSSDLPSPIIKGTSTVSECVTTDAPIYTVLGNWIIQWDDDTHHPHRTLSHGFRLTNCEVWCLVFFVSVRMDTFAAFMMRTNLAKTTEALLYAYRELEGCLWDFRK